MGYLGSQKVDGPVFGSKGLYDLLRACRGGEALRESFVSPAVGCPTILLTVLQSCHRVQLL